MAVFWKTNYYKADPKKAYAEIMTLDEITSENVVELARSESSVLHDDFEWDDAIAGNKWRNHQARRLIENLVVEVEERDTKEPVQIRVLHTTPDRHDYKPIEFFLKDADEHKKLLNQAMRELEYFKKKYYSLVELTPVFEAINAL